MLENLDDRAQVLRRVQAVEDISQAPKQQRREKIKLWADRLEVHPRTVTRLLERVEKEGLASLVRFTRIDAGATRGSNSHSALQKSSITQSLVLRCCCQRVSIGSIAKLSSLRDQYMS